MKWQNCQKSFKCFLENNGKKCFKTSKYEISRWLKLTILDRGRFIFSTVFIMVDHNAVIVPQFYMSASSFGRAVVTFYHVMWSISVFLWRLEKPALWQDVSTHRLWTNPHKHIPEKNSRYSKTARVIILYATCFAFTTKHQHQIKHQSTADMRHRN